MEVTDTENDASAERPWLTGSEAEPATTTSNANQSTPPASEPAPVIAHTIDLDLGGRRQRYPLKPTDGKAYRLVRITDCPIAFVVDPEDGHFDEHNQAAVVITGRHDVRLVASVETPHGSAIVIEPLVRTDEGKEIPFILANLEKIRARIAKRTADAAEQLAALIAEQDRLMAWLSPWSNRWPKWGKPKPGS